MTGKQLTLLGGSFGPPPAYQISRSLRFNSADSAYLDRTFASAGSRTTWTWSAWIKRSGLGTLQYIFTASGAATGTSSVAFNADNTLEFYTFDSSYTARLTTSQVFRDVSAWYHIVAVFDTTSATTTLTGSSTDRMRLYVNGVQVSNFSNTTVPSQNYQGFTNSNVQHVLNGRYNGSYVNTNGNWYMTEVQFIDGSALTAASFGETDTDTGVWKPKAYTGTYGTNGFYLNFSDNSNTTSTTLGKDYSGNGNNWTPNNFSVTAGVGNDSLVDTPTPYGTDTGVGGEVRGNYCTLNPLYGAASTISNGNLDATYAAGTTSYGTFSFTTGKWYWELRVATAITGGYVGIIDSTYIKTDSNWSTESRTYETGGQKYNGTSSSYGATWGNGDVIGIAVDMDAGTIVFYKNGASQGTAFSDLSGKEWKPLVYATSVTYNMNFGQRPFAYTAPSGFKALCTQNLPTPDIGATASTMADDYFNVAIWTANGSGAVDRAITSTFQPDMIWSKTRSAAYHNNIFDAVRGFGSNIALVTDQAWSEGTASGGRIKSVASTSFTWEAGGSAAEWYNQSSNTYVSWYWKANGAGSSNSAGSITSTVSANVDAGFSIVTYTGTGANATVGHGCKVNNVATAPSMIIVKGRNVATSWRVYHTSIGNTGAMYFNLTNATDTNSVFWNNTSPTSSVFTVGTDPGVNGSSNTFVAYCFAPVAGYSAFGKYVGNGSDDGPFVYLGFRPKWILIKPSDSADSWQLEDAVRSPFNTVNDQLFPNSAQAEQVDSATRNTDFLSNGFKLRGTNSGVNGNAVNYIYAAFAEFPFKYTLAR